MPATIGILLNESDLRTFTDIGNNYRTADLNNSIRIAQDMRLRPILGNPLYQRFLDDLAAATQQQRTDGSWVTGDYATLYNGYITDFLLYESYREFLETNFIRPQNSGLSLSTSSAATGASDAQYEKKRNAADNKAEYYATRLTQFLEANANDYSEYRDLTDTLEVDRPGRHDVISNPLKTLKRRSNDLNKAKALGFRISDSLYGGERDESLNDY